MRTNERGLSTGALVGIIVGVIIAVVVPVTIAVVLLVGVGGGGGGGGILEGATNYTGSYPAVADVTFVDADNLTRTVAAYPGQVQVFFFPSADQSYAQSAIQSNGGTILSSIPLTGYYLVQVNVGSEGTFISAILTDPQVRGAMPNLALEMEQDGVVINEDYLTNPIPVPLNVHGPVAIDSGQHALDVTATAQANGGTIADIVNITRLQDSRTPGDKWTLALNAIAQGNAIFNPGATTFINISQGAGYRDDAVSGDTNGNGRLGDWSDWTNLPEDLQQKAINNRIAFMKNVLMGAESLPADLFNNTFITMSAGNNNMPLDSMLSTLRANADWDTILRTKIAIATCPTSLYNQANQGPPGDPSIVVMTNPQAENGTSFASPAANAAVQHLTREDILNIQNATGATFAQVTKAADLAKATNANSQVIPDEVQDKANIIVTAATDPSGAYLVTSINFTSVGGTTSAVISPASSGVTVQFTVSGTDGYYDSGSLQTDSSGNVSFYIPAGASGVVDTISVVAVLSGRVASRTYTW